MPATSQKGNGRPVLAGHLAEICINRQPCGDRAAQILGRILDPNNIRQFGKPGHRRNGHIDHRPAWNVVDDDRQTAFVMDGLVVQIETFLGRLVVIRCNHKGRIGAGCLGMLRQFDRFLGGIRASTRDDRDTSVGDLNAPFRDFHVFVMAEGRRFASRAAGHEAVAAFRNLPINESLEGRFVEFSILERRYQRRKRALEHGLLLRTQGRADHSRRRASRQVVRVPNASIESAVNPSSLGAAYARPYHHGMVLHANPHLRLRHRTLINHSLRCLATLILVFAVALLVSPLRAEPAAGKAIAPPIDAHSISILESLFKAIDQKRWKQVSSLESKLTDPFAKKLALWGRLSAPSGPANLDELTRFIHYNPQYPRINRLIRKAEGRLSAEGSDEQVLTWFKDREPLTTLGKARLGAALLKSKKNADRVRGEAFIKQAWIDGNFSKSDGKQFMRTHGQRFGVQDHIDRLDRLLWEGRYWDVRSHLWRVPKAYQALGLARVALRRQQGNVDRLVSLVPTELQRDPGLIYERLRWRRRKGKASAMELARHLPDNLPYPEKWWEERSVLVRGALKQGYISDAYRIARNHGLSDGGDYAEAEWLAGWVALRFLNEPVVGLQHFSRMYAKVNFPISRARGAYWIARSYSAMGEARRAEEWHRRAARYSTTYYGQLSLAKIDPTASLTLPAPQSPSSDVHRQFTDHELTRAFNVLAAAKAHRHLRTILQALFRRADDHPGWRALVADLAVQADRLDLGVTMAKLSAQHGQILADVGYPTIALPRIPGKWNLPNLEKPLVLSMIRQESVFHVSAISRARAQGLMQLMPATAAAVAKRHGLKYSKSRLLTDPNYNMTLGQSYLAGLLSDFDGSYVLSIAAYNAGPHRVAKWIKQNGDPRHKDVDVIDWVELIPFDETRNYVQRVMENLHIYRSLLADTEVAFAPHADLSR